MRRTRLNAGQRALYALTWADDEILDGGFWQFFSNNSGHAASRRRHALLRSCSSFRPLSVSRSSTASIASV
jgi:hypothetical protein